MDVFNRLTEGNPTEEFRDEEEHELLVFGYQCKLFRDDEKAVYIDCHRHLIPWMGDPSLMIDRYDGRGYLHDLHRYDADKTKAQFEEPTEEEKRIEALCDEERYLEFHTDLAERAMYEEEELKRLNEAVSEEYAAVGYSYEYDQQGKFQLKEKEEEKDSEEEEEDEEFVAPPSLQIPKGMVTPSGSKLNAIIEKTAKFISQHGLQMEIMIKMKQKDNMQFSFLNHDDSLNPYYKHVVSMIKAGKYKPEPQKHKRKRNSSENVGDGYLHPSLAVTTNPSSAISEEPKDVLSVIQDKLPAGQIKNTAYAKLVNKIGKQQTGRFSPMLSNRNLKSGSSSPVPQHKPSLPMVQGQSLAGIDGHSKSTLSQPPEHYMAVMERPPMQLVPSYMDPSVPLPPPPGMEPVMLPTSDQPPPPGTEPANLPPDMPPNFSHEEHIEPLHTKRPEKIVPPPPDMKPIVDKMAMYVAKNGPEFEATVRNKGDERFAFLLDHHPFYPYYDNKRREHEQELARLKGNHQAGGAAVGAGKGFGFKIKAKETDAATLRTKTALLYESSDDDDESKERKRQKAEAGDSAPYEPSLPTADDDSMDGMEKQTPAVETVEKSEKKLAEEKLKDKLAMAARGKLAQSSKEKQLQAERKRKAAMFLTMIKGSQQSEESGPKPSLGEENNTKKEITSSDKPSPPAIRKHSHSRSPPHFIRRRRSRSKSPVSSRHRRSRSPLEVRDRRSKRSPKYRRSRSKSPWKRRSKTPPTAFAAFRRSSSRSPRRKKSRSKSPSKSKKSKSKSKKRSRSRSKSKSKSKSKKRSRSRSPKHKSKSKSSRSKRSRSRSKSPSRKKSKSKKKSRSRSPSSRKRSRSRSPKRKEPSRSRSRSRVKSAIPSPAHDTPSTVPGDVEIIHIDDGQTEVEAKETRSNGSSRNGSTASFSLPDQTTANTSDNNSGSTNLSTSNTEPEKPVSMDLLSKVRAMLKASREAIAKEGDLG